MPALLPLKFLAATAMVLVILSAVWAMREGPLRDPEAAMKDFYAATARAEDQLADPLILNGHGVVPLVVKDIQHKEMPLRRYAIGFLGNGRYGEALPILKVILADETEKFYFRADALIAIHQISPSVATDLAHRYVNGEELLGRVAKQIVSGAANDSGIFERRSWWKAFFAVHE